MFILNVYTTVTSNLDFEDKSSLGAFTIEFVFKMIHSSLRIMWMKNFKSVKTQPIELLCQHYGKKCKNLSNDTILKKLFSFLQRKKAQKRNLTEQPKGVVNAFMKGMNDIINRKKEPVLTDS